MGLDKENLDAICNMMRTDKETLDEIWKQVKINHKKLDNCDGPHEFEPMQHKDGELVRRYRCKKCGGEIDAIHHIWYKRGFEHGQRHVETDSKKAT
jgi:hypothetical protein